MNVYNDMRYTKYTTIQKIQKLQKMNYANYTNYKIKHLKCLILFSNFRLFFPNVRKCFGTFGVFVKEMVIFNMGFGLHVFNSIWEHGLKIFFDQKR